MTEIHRPVLLIVDDNPEFQVPLEILLREGPYSLYSAMNGREGLRLARELLPALILLDLVLPGLDGWEVLHHLRRDLSTARIPVLIMSGLPLTGEEVMKRGAQGYLQKPFSFHRLESEMDRCIALR